MIPLNLFPYAPMSGHVACEKQGLTSWVNLIYEPGDGVKYTLMVVGPLPSPVECGELGAVDVGGYLVVAGNTDRRCMLIQGRGVLTVAYVAEKLRVSEPLAEAITIMIQAATGRESYGTAGKRLRSAADARAEAEAKPDSAGPDRPEPT